MATSIRERGVREAPPLVQAIPDDLADRPAPDWLRSLRVEAGESLRADGLPGKRDEAWRFTPTRALVTPTYAPAAEAAPALGPGLVRSAFGDDDGTHRVVLANGRLVPEIGDGDTGLPDGIVVRGLADALGDAGAEPRIGEVLGRLAERRHFAGLNAAMFEDGLLVEVAPGTRVERPLHLVHVALSGSSPVVSYPRVVIRVGSGAELTLVESHLHDGGEPHLTDGVTEVLVEGNASLDHTRAAADASPTGWRVETLAVRVDASGRYASRVVTLGGGFARLDLQVTLAGPGAEARLDGVYHAADGDLVDHHLRVDHQAPHSSSHQTYRGILDGRGKAVFDTIARVRAGAGGAAAHQENRNLLLSDQADLHTKPHLEIETDDVSASHGATVGALDEDSLFYLRSRGVDRATAEALLTYSFVETLVEPIPHAPTRERLAQGLLSRLPQGGAIRELLGMSPPGSQGASNR
jgi:Fe-S cluster assembly protein SufD